MHVVRVGGGAESSKESGEGSEERKSELFCFFFCVRSRRSATMPAIR